MATNFLRTYRSRAGLSIAELSKRAGVSAVQIYNIEAAKNWPKIETQRKICQVLKMEESEIFPEPEVPVVDRPTLPAYVTTEWEVTVKCPHCRGSFLVKTFSPSESGTVDCPYCGFRQSIKMERG